MTRAERLAEIARLNRSTQLDKGGLVDPVMRAGRREVICREHVPWLLSQLALADAVVEAARDLYEGADVPPASNLADRLRLRLAAYDATGSALDNGEPTAPKQMPRAVKTAYTKPLQWCGIPAGVLAYLINRIIEDSST